MQRNPKTKECGSRWSDLNYHCILLPTLLCSYRSGDTMWHCHVVPSLKHTCVSRLISLLHSSVPLSLPFPFADGDVVPEVVTDSPDLTQSLVFVFGSVLHYTACNYYCCCTPFIRLKIHVVKFFVRDILKVQQYNVKWNPLKDS